MTLSALQCPQMLKPEWLELCMMKLWPLKDGLADQKDDSLLKNQGDIWEEWDDRKAVTCKTG